MSPCSIRKVYLFFVFRGLRWRDIHTDQNFIYYFKMRDKTNQRLKALFISGWYPNRYDPMFGLFVAKHAEAARLYCDTAVIYVHSVDNQDVQTELTDQMEDGVNVIRIYYPKPQMRFLSTFQKAIAYFFNIKKAYKYYKEKHGKPDIIHANILTRAAYAAMKLADKDGIPFVVTEHWSRYLPTRNEYHGFLRKMLSERAISKAAAFMPVSENLRQAMEVQKLHCKNTKVVANVVDDVFFENFSTEFPNTEKKHIIHVSCFDERAKNITGILDVIKRISEFRQDFYLDIVGDGPDRNQIWNHANELGLTDRFVFFKGLYKKEELSKAYASAHFLLMFSNYENAPVVINEAFAAGIPVVATRVGGIAEVVSDQNGMLVDAGDEQQLEQTILNMLACVQDYDKTQIHNFAREHFSMEYIGKQLFNVYRRALNLV